jgi:ribosome maturation factor RimP
MDKLSVSQRVRNAVEPVVRDDGIELVDVEYKKTGKVWTLRVIIDKELGVNVGDCQQVSRQIEDLIEIEDLVPTGYVLEVSSPGLDRPLKSLRDFIKFKDKRITVSLFSPVDGKKKLDGRIQDCRDETLHLEVNGVSIEIPLKNIGQAKLIIEF